MRAQSESSSTRVRFAAATARAMGFVANALPLIRMINVFLVFYTLANLCSPVRAAALRAAPVMKIRDSEDWARRSTGPLAPGTVLVAVPNVDLQSKQTNLVLPAHTSEISEVSAVCMFLCQRRDNGFPTPPLLSLHHESAGGLDSRRAPSSPSRCSKSLSQNRSRYGAVYVSPSGGWNQ